jgi:hypothetical protein
MRARLTAAVLALASASTLSAQSITSPGDPALAGQTVIDFSGAALGQTTTLSVGGVTFSAPGGSGVIVENDYAGNYNTSGQYLANQGWSFGTLRFDFGSAASAFGFNFGASDMTWTVTAFDAFGAVLASTSIAPTGGSNGGEFIGLSTGSANIAYGTVTGDASDYVMVDNFGFVAADVGTTVTPEPASVALMATGLLGLVGVAHRKRAARRDA